MAIGDSRPAIEVPACKALPLWFGMPINPNEQVSYLAQSLLETVQGCPKGLVIEALAMVSGHLAGSFPLQLAETQECEMAKQFATFLRDQLSPTAAVRVASWILFAVMVRMKNSPPEEREYWQKQVGEDEPQGLLR